MLWRQRRWRELLTLIDWLPRNSAYMEALTDDDEVAAQMLARPQDRRVSRPRISEYSAELEKLTDIVDRLGEVMQAVVAAAGGKPPKVKPQPRPRTALDRLREQRRREQHRKIVSRVMVMQEDGSLVPLAQAETTKPAQPAKPPLLPGEDPYRLRATRHPSAPPRPG